jgi:hypothetical protein
MLAIEINMELESGAAKQVETAVWSTMWMEQIETTKIRSAPLKWNKK